MDDIETWLMEELGHLGFSLTPMMYDVNNFLPMRGVMYTYHDNVGSRTIKLRTRIMPELANDLQGWGRTYENEVDDYKQMVINEIQRELGCLGLPSPWGPKDFTPFKKINKFKFNDK